MVDALGDVVLTEFDKQPELFNDASISEQIKAMVNKIKGLSLGIFNEKDVAKVASSHVRAVSSASKSNVNSQVAVSGVNPIETEPWIKDYTNVKVAENVSYITNIKDEYTQKIEQTIYRGVAEGKSNAEMKEELVQQTGMAENKAKFIARDQTGTLLGQMNAERHARAGIEAFIWKDSDDGAVRATHAERDGHLYYYDDSPLLPGTEYGCRCIAKPAFEEDIEKAEVDGTAVHGAETKRKEPEEPIKEKPLTQEEKWEKTTTEIKEKVDKGVTSLEDMQDVGGQFAEIIKEKETSLLTEYEELSKEVTYLSGEGLTKVQSESREVIDQFVDDYQIKYKKQQEMYNKIITGKKDLIKEELSKIRDVGIDTKGNFSKYSNPANKKAFSIAYKYLPKTWVEKFIENPIYTPQVQRGYFRASNKSFKDLVKEVGLAEKDLKKKDYGKFYDTVAISGIETNRKLRTIFHELGHFAENKVDGIKAIEHKFYQKRTKNEELKWLGNGYRKTEVTRFDDFLNPYMGKDYGNTEDSPYELLSMGLESIFNGSYNLEEDIDFRNFIYGILITK